jgi:hypothetical protein
MFFGLLKGDHIKVAEEARSWICRQTFCVKTGLDMIAPDTIGPLCSVHCSAHSKLLVLRIWGSPSVGRGNTFN